MVIDSREGVPRQEILLGDHDMVSETIDMYVRLPQIRPDLNPELPNLKSSIATRGLLNPIDVACMSELDLKTYITFVNKTWKSNVSFDDYSPFRQPNGNYFLVVAGHSRVEAITQLQAENPDFVYRVKAKVHDVSSPQEIISIQIDENIHSKPPQEQQAIAIVETYEYGKLSGLWKNKKEFLHVSGEKFSIKSLNAALGFAQLPPEVRDFVFAGNLGYNAAVSLGVAASSVIEYVSVRFGLDDISLDADELMPEITKAYKEELGFMIAYIANKNLNGTAAKKYIDGQVTEMKRKIAKIMNKDDDQEAGLFGIGMITQSELTRAYNKERHAKYLEALRDLRAHSPAATKTALALHRELTGVENPELAAMDENAQRLFGGLGQHATSIDGLVILNTAS